MCKRLVIISFLLISTVSLFAFGKKEDNKDPLASDAVGGSESVTPSTVGGESLAEGDESAEALAVVGEDEGSVTDVSSTPPNSEETPYGAIQVTSAETGETVTLNSESFISQLWGAIKVIFFFGIVIGILFLLVRVFKKINKGSFVSDTLIDVVSSRQLAGSRYLHVIRMGNEYMLVSSTDGSINLIKTIEDKETIDILQLHKEKNAEPDNRNFRDIFRDIVKPGNSTLGGGQKMQESMQKLKKQGDRLKKM